MVTSSRCVTIVGSMAYLIGTRVDGSDIADTVGEKGRTLPLAARNESAVAESACSTAMLDVIGVFLSNRTALESARSMGRGERDGRGEAGEAGWSISRFMDGSFCNVRRKQREHSRAARIRGSVGKECDPIS
jgi:phosphate/sulfate permease